jgi:NTE family protein
MTEIEAINTVPGSELIQETFLFKYFNFDETMAMSAICQRVEFRQGKIIIEEGELGQALYLIVEGKVRVFKGQGESEQDLAILGRGELFGEMSLIENDLTSASVMAHTDVHLLQITRSDFEKLLDSNKDIAFNVYKTFCHTLSERLRKTSEELARLREECEKLTG